MYSRYTPSTHRLRKLELTYRLMYFLRDVGVKTAHSQAVDNWTEYMYCQAALMSSVC